MNKLRIWVVPQIGSDAGTFVMPVPNPETGRRILDALANYDLFQFNNKVKPDYSSASGLEELTDDGDPTDDDAWDAWDDGNGNGIDAYRLTTDAQGNEQFTTY